jgi:hypothetical protein
MNEHLTEQQLIDYAYKLASEAEMEAARDHLDACSECRRTLERLRARLASLELLRDEIQPSDALIARVVEEAAQPRRVAIFPYWHVFAVGGTAAVFVAGIVWLLLHTFMPRQAERPAGEQFARDETRAPATLEGDKGAVAGSATLALGFQPEEGVLSAAAPVAVPAVPPAQTFAFAATAPAAGAIDETPPFAPASAIELVVLPRREDVQLTIYNSADLTLVRERRNLTLKRGWNWLQFMWANTLIDPTSLTLEPLEHQGQVDIQQLVYPPRLRELARWLIRSEVSGQVPFEITYLTSGLSWRAFYMGTLAQDEKTMHLDGYVRVDNHSGEEYEDAQTRLVVGQVHILDQIRDLAQRQYAYGRPESVEHSVETWLRDKEDLRTNWYFQQEATDGLSLGLEMKEIVKEALSEYTLYTIEGTETIPNEWGKRLLSFEADDIPVKSLYKYDEERYGAETVRFLSFANDAEHELGETPIPEGMVRIYGQTDAEAHLSYVGGTNIKYIPVGEEVELNLGPARLVKVEPTLMQTATSNYVFDSNDNVIGWDEVQIWKVEVTNPRTLPVEVEITRGFDSPYWKLTSSNDGVAYAKHDVTHARFTLSVEPRRKRSFSYTVTIYRGTRSEQYLKLEAEDQR